MQSWVVAVEQFHFRVLNGLNYLLGYQFYAVVNAGQIFGGVQQEGCAGSEQGTAVSSDYSAVGKFYGRGVGILL